jgi:hypothetical protein
MKSILLLLALAIASICAAQDKSIAAWELLETQGVSKEDHLLIFYSETPFGTFVSTQVFKKVVTIVDGTPTDGWITTSFDTYVRVGDSSTLLMDQLRGYRVYGYYPPKQSLVIGLFDEESMTDPQVDRLFTFNVVTSRFVEQGKFSGGIYNARVVNDQLSLMLNRKNANGVGSTPTWIPYSVK